MIFDPPDYRKGDSLSAKQLNAANREIRRIGQISGSAGINVSGGKLSLSLPERFYIKLTSTANGNGGYAWKEVHGARLGTWTDTSRTGTQATDPAYERSTRNATLTVNGKVYEAMRNEQTGEVLFE